MEEKVKSNSIYKIKSKEKDNLIWEEGGSDFRV